MPSPHISVHVLAVVELPPVHCQPVTGPVQSPLHFVKLDKSPSSHASVTIFNPSPQIAVHTEGTATEQVQPVSMLQVFEHPSPDTKLLSSQFSPTTLIASPQIGVQILGEATVQEYPIFASEQSGKHLPTPKSSHTSGRITSPSPHIGEHTEGFPGAHVYPTSTVHVFEQPSIEAEIALSHCSVPVFIRSPQVSIHVVAVVGVPPEQVYPGAAPVQSPKQLVKDIKSPSSHTSDVIQRPSPQIAEQTFGLTAKEQVNPVSITQRFEQPSNRTAFPSSHSSPEVQILFPQTSLQTVGEVISPPAQTHPGASAEQSFKHPSVLIPFPSSQISP